MSTNSDDGAESESAGKSRSIFGRNLPFERETAWFILVSVLDILMTYKLLAEKGFREANPVARYFIDRWGAKGMIFFKMGMVAFITVVAQLIATRNRSAARWVLFFGIAVVTFVVLYSMFLLARTRGIL